MLGSHDIVIHTVTGGLGINYLQVHDAVDGDFDVVLGDTALAWHVTDDFLLGMLVGNPVDKGHQKVEARLQGCLVLAQPFHHIHLPLRHDANHHEEQNDNAEGDESGNN